ncbi:MAG TPA: DsbA family oxidoreductase [Planctomycetota bacterium]|nr:DsbA family oxidoreductase [Planctomycetota bacterium]
MPISIAVHSDVICPWCWIGKRRLEQALATLPVGAATVSWHPFQLNPGMPSEGMPRVEYRRRKFGSAEYAQALDARVTGVAAEVGLAFDLAGQGRTPNTLRAHRLIRWAGDQGRQDALVEALFSAYFSAGLDVGDPAVLTRLAAGVGLDADAVTRFITSSEGTEEVLAEERAIRQQGAEGVPLFVINGQERLSGAQPVAVFVAALAQAAIAAEAGGPNCADGVCRP